MKALFTAEDAHHVHKLLGVYALVHFASRYFFFIRYLHQAQSEDDDMGFRADWLTFASLSPHLLLQLSGLKFFKLPRRRIKEGSRIWPEYRWHALVFASRSLALMGLAAVRQAQAAAVSGRADAAGAVALRPHTVPALAIVVAASFAADCVSRWYDSRGESSRTIRDLDVPPAAQYLMSAAQFHATLGCLLTTDRFSVQLVSLMVIQCAAFIMTLRRRNIITHLQDVSLYGFLLAAGLVVVVCEASWQGYLGMALTVANAAAIARLSLGLSKYAIWPAVALVLPHALPHPSTPSPSAPRAQPLLWAWQAGAILSTVTLFVLASLNGQGGGGQGTGGPDRSKHGYDQLFGIQELHQTVVARVPSDEHGRVDAERLPFDVLFGGRVTDDDLVGSSRSQHR